MKKLIQYTLTLLGAVLSPALVLAQDETTEEVVQIVEQSRPMYERFGMTSTELFVLMVSITILLVIILVSLLLNTGKMIRYMAENKPKDGKGKEVLLLLIGMFASTGLFAKEPYVQQEFGIAFPDSSFWILLSFDLVLIALILHVSGIMNGILYKYVPKRKSRFWKAFQKSMVDATPIESEASILLDHDYDGIKELDNNLPPWWKYGFYITIVWGLFYFTYYSVLGGESQEQEYLTSVEEGEREVAEYKAAHPELVTEESAEFLTDASTLSQGGSIFKEKCVTCHMEGGAGGAGPNLTDDYWIYGNDMQTVFHTISEGAKNGMKSWKDELNGIEIQAVASYLLQLDPILPPNGQEPKGDYMEPVYPKE